MILDYSSTLKNLLKYYVLDVSYVDSMYYVKADYTALSNIFLFLRNHTLCRFTVLYDLSVVVNPYSVNSKNKFTVYYYLSSLKHNSKMIIGFQILNETKVLNSLFTLFKSCVWLEREVWDMYGIFFEGNPDLRRILTDYGFKYNPLLKEYPLKGYVELKFHDSNSLLQYVKVNDQQQAKIFDFKNP
jgi:NADH-quinone oxidoreductase subunit C